MPRRRRVERYWIKHSGVAVKLTPYRAELKRMQRKSLMVQVSEDGTLWIWSRGEFIYMNKMQSHALYKILKEVFEK